MPTKDLSHYRKEIDSLDSKIAPLLTKRFNAVKKVGVIKRNYNLPLHNPKREVEVLKNVESASGGDPLIKTAMQDTYRQIIKSSKKLEISLYKR